MIAKFNYVLSCIGCTRIFVGSCVWSSKPSVEVQILALVGVLTYDGQLGFLFVVLVGSLVDETGQL